jgi:RHS repeat-associated protein
LGQLLSAVQPDLKETFAFDPAGNLIDRLKKEKEREKPQEKPTSDQASPQTQPVSPVYVHHNRLEHSHNLDYVYDIQGNTVLKRIRPLPELNTQAANETATLDLAYDQENRLVKAVKQYGQASVTAHYVYDAFGRRIAKSVSEASWEKNEQKIQAEKDTTPRTTWFLWDGDNLIQEIHSDKTVTFLYEPESFIPLTRIESDEGQQAYLPASIHMPPVSDWEMLEAPFKCEAHVVQWQHYQVGETEKTHQTQWKQRLEKAKRDAAQDRIHYFHCDHLGTPQALYDEAGKEVWAARYRAWGKIYHYETKEVEQPLRFQGQYEDGETGLYYNRHRYYDPDIERFITQDPIKLDGGENLYIYVPSPIGWIDPLGLARRGPRPQTALDEIQSLPEFTNQRPCDVRKTLRGRKYHMAGSHSNPTGSNQGGQVWTKPMPDGNTASVRIDPAMVRNPPLGFADEQPHVHKETVPTANVSNGNYGPPHQSGSVPCDDCGQQKIGPMAQIAQDIHILIKKGRLR